ncbi:hypothetical protein ElyMa_002292900 [Elysia marginata]|uniref:Uncharacterized protein n=1 Tax=Elysia marginata TaxID=1093978 RepID=A0AAV4G2A2_9GAST|nr:hypothetical protein ElyMa_002292900 [Elysia marginata]
MKPLQYLLRPRTALLILMSKMSVNNQSLSLAVSVCLIPTMNIKANKDDHKLRSGNRQDGRQNKTDHEEDRIRTRTTRRHLPPCQLRDKTNRPLGHPLQQKWIFGTENLTLRSLNY